MPQTSFSFWMNRSSSLFLLLVGTGSSAMVWGCLFCIPHPFLSAWTVKPSCLKHFRAASSLLWSLKDSQAAPACILTSLYFQGRLVKPPAHTAGSDCETSTQTCVSLGLPHAEQWEPSKYFYLDVEGDMYPCQISDKECGDPWAQSTAKHVTVWNSHTCAKVSAEPQMIHCCVCVTQFSLASVPGSVMFCLCRLFNEKEQWQVTSQTGWDEENEEGSQGVQHFSHLLVKSHGDLWIWKEHVLRCHPQK